MYIMIKCEITMKALSSWLALNAEKLGLLCQKDAMFLLSEFPNYKAKAISGPSGSGHETVAVLLPGFAINW